MNMMDTVYALAEIVEMLSKLVRDQADIIEQHNLLDEEESRTLEKRRTEALKLAGGEDG